MHSCLAIGASTTNPVRCRFPGRFRPPDHLDHTGLVTDRRGRAKLARDTPGDHCSVVLHLAVLRTTYYADGMARNTPSGLRRENDPPLLILTSLAAGPKHGYALSKDIEEFSNIVLSPGALYGAITRLEERGLIEPLAEVERRRPYRITAAGSASLSEVVREMNRVAKVASSRLGLVVGAFA